MERWKPVLGFEGRYEVSDQGNVRSFCKGKNRILSPGTGVHGYLYVLLYHSDGKRKIRLVHRLVVEAFIGSIPPKMDVNHKNGAKKFNYLENLEILSRSENQLHNYRELNPSHNRAKGEEQGSSLLTEKQVLKIRALSKSGMSLRKLAIKFRCSKSAVAHIVYRRSWKHI